MLVCAYIFGELYPVGCWGIRRGERSVIHSHCHKASAKIINDIFCAILLCLGLKVELLRLGHDDMRSKTTYGNCLPHERSISITTTSVGAIVAEAKPEAGCRRHI
jgi:hypothetical protein